jgi:hypothetical protein
MRTLAGLSALLLLAGCREDVSVVPREPAGTLKVKFRPTWNGSGFDKTSVYLSAADERVLVQQVKFYLSPIVLLGDQDGSASQAELLDLTDGPVERSFRMKPGAYDSLRYGLGVPYDLNHRDLTTVPVPDPLDFTQGMYWTWATMYRFMVFEGRYDTDPGATGTPPYTFSMHTGRDECYRERTIPCPVEVVDEQVTELTLEVDIARFFTDGTEVLDLSQGPQSHGEAQNLAPALRLSDLAVKAISKE